MKHNIMTVWHTMLVSKVFIFLNLYWCLLFPERNGAQAVHEILKEDRVLPVDHSRLVVRDHHLVRQAVVLVRRVVRVHDTVGFCIRRCVLAVVGCRDAVGAQANVIRTAHPSGIVHAFLWAREMLRFAAITLIELVAVYMCVGAVMPVAAHGVTTATGSACRLLTPGVLLGTTTDNLLLRLLLMFELVVTEREAPTHGSDDERKYYS